MNIFKPLHILDRKVADLIHEVVTPYHAKLEVDSDLKWKELHSELTELTADVLSMDGSHPVCDEDMRLLSEISNALSQVVETRKEQSDLCSPFARKRWEADFFGCVLLSMELGLRRYRLENRYFALMDQLLDHRRDPAYA